MFIRLVSLLALLLIASASHAFEFSYKGMIKTELVNSNQGVASFGSGYSHVAPTNALRTDIFNGAPATPQETSYLESPATSFQAAQSRFSLNMSHKNVRSVVEFDFIDGEDGFTNQTALQAQEPRLRLATLYFDANDNWTLFAGQKWSTASGIKSNGSNSWVGNGYRAGNTGFFAMEAGATFKNAGWSVTGALTGRGRNLSSSGINGNELGGVPGFALDVNYKWSGSMVGFAGHLAQVNFEDEPGFVEGSNQDINFYKVYTSLKFGDDVTLNAEVYTGESLNNQNALGIAPPTVNSGGMVREGFSETGYFAYLSWNVAPGHNLKVQYGSAEVDSGDRDRLSLTELSKNSTAYVSYNYKVIDSLTAFGQVTHFDTEYGSDFESFSAVVTRIGVIFKF